MIVWLVIVGVVFVAAMALFVRRARREIVESRQPAPLESGRAREAVRAAIERRQ
jgi:heme/copper-type cytochrome/quinol oxidase subunit 2